MYCCVVLGLLFELQQWRWPGCDGGVGVGGMVVGLSLCWVGCWHGEDMVCVWISIWVVLLDGETIFHPKVWMLCVHCFLMGLVGWSATGKIRGSMSSQ